MKAHYPLTLNHSSLNILDNYTTQLVTMGCFLILTSKMTGYTIPGVGVAPARGELEFPFPIILGKY